MAKISIHLSPKLRFFLVISAANTVLRPKHQPLRQLMTDVSGLMVTKRAVDEWLIEPDVEGSREYGRLGVYAEPDGLNIDGQGIIPWAQLESSRLTYTVHMKKRHAAR